jgi:aldehyde:ferredoxin oxidoreductase
LWEGLARLLVAATGIAFDSEVIEDAANRIYLVERTFNCLRGITRSDDRLALSPAMKAGAQWPVEEKNHQEMLSAYYDARGYDRCTGIPTDAVLRRYELAPAAAALADAGRMKAWDGPPLWAPERYPSGGRRV